MWGWRGQPGRTFIADTLWEAVRETNGRWGTGAQCETRFYFNFLFILKFVGENIPNISCTHFCPDSAYTLASIVPLCAPTILSPRPLCHPQQYRVSKNFPKFWWKLHVSSSIRTQDIDKTNLVACSSIRRKQVNNHQIS